MLRHSFTADSFAGFWKNWNPLFSYYLLYHCYRPLRRFLPRFPAVVFTFAVSGGIHDIAATIALMEGYFLFTPVFTGYGIFLILEEIISFSAKGIPVSIRPIYHLTVIIGMFFLVKLLI